MEETDPNKQARSWCFTWFTDTTKDEVWQPALRKLKASYIIAGKEICPTTGRQHLQGYAQFKSGKRFSTLVKALKGPHYLVAKGNAKQNYEYCSKEGEFWEEGEVSEQGKRMDLEVAMTDIKAGMKELDFFETHPMVMFRYPKGCDRYRMLCEKEKMKGFHKKEVFVFWGKTRTGKTKGALEIEPDAFIVSSSLTGLWWDGYDGETEVIMDEFRDSSCALSQLLRILDGYYVSVPIRGGAKTLCAMRIIITSNVDPQKWYEGCDRESREALFGRFDKVLEFKTEDDIIECPTVLKPIRKIDPMAGYEDSDTD